jgi:hypothetical protein
MVAVLGADVTHLIDELDAVIYASDAERADEVIMALKYIRLAQAASSLIGDLDQIATNLPTLLSGAGDYVVKTQIDKNIVLRLLDLLIMSQVYSVSSPVFALLSMLGIFTVEHHVADASVYQVEHLRAVVRYDRIPKLFGHPAELFSDVYGWGTVSFDAGMLLRNLATAFESVSLRPRMSTVPLALEERILGHAIPGADRDPSPQVLLGTTFGVADLATEFGVSFQRLRASSPGGADAGLILVPYASGSINDQIPMLPGLNLEILGSFSVTGGAGMLVRPTGVQLQSGLLGDGAVATSTTGRLGLGIHHTSAPSTATPILSAPGGITIDAREAYLRFQAGADEGSPLDFTAELGVVGGRLIIGLSDADSFVSKVLSQSSIRLDLDLGLQWSKLHGVAFSGHTGLTADFTLHQVLGPVLLTDLRIAVAADASALTLVGTVSGGVEVGPVFATVTNIGFRAKANLTRGNLGPIDLAIGFKPPDGIALAISAPGVSGSGFVQFDETTGQYLGALALSVADVSIEAVGVLTTRSASGASEYSLIILASAGFPPVELGFGFDLTGLGGLIGVNRTINVPGLQALARAGSLDNLMFPADLKHNAPQVAASLGTLFPTAEGHFIVGPAVRLAWGTNGILDAEIAVYIELSDSGGGISLLRVALLGWMHLTLPDAKAPIADIKLDVLGIVDLPAKTLSIDAGLRNSKIAGFTLTGQAALRASWGASPSFVLALGGFNPHFAAPSGFPSLDRIALSLGGDNPRLRLTAYLAVTSNTLQLGASADLYASAGPAAVKASLSFDALIQYKPFGLIVDLSISASILFDNSPLLTLLLELHLVGPDPWQITGQASIQVLFATFTVPINLTVGPTPAPQLPQTVDLDKNLETALLDLHNWQTGPPPGAGLVMIRGLAAADPAVHPLGTLTVRQHAVPFGLPIVRYGPDLLDAPCQYDIVDPQIAGTPDQNVSKVTDYFAPSQFNTMTDTEKLSSPSFQLMNSGLTFGPPGYVVPAGVGTGSSRGFNNIVFDSPDPVGSTAAPVVKSSPPPLAVPPDLLKKQQAGAAAAMNGSSGQGAARYAATGLTKPIRLIPPTYGLVNRNLQPLGVGGPVLGLSSYISGLGQLAGMGATGGAGQVVYSSEVPGNKNPQAGSS